MASRKKKTEAKKAAKEKKKNMATPTSQLEQQTKKAEEKRKKKAEETPSHLLGAAKRGKGNVIHAIANGHRLLCDSRVKAGFETLGKISLAGVNCKKCQRHSLHKQALAALKEKKEEKKKPEEDLPKPVGKYLTEKKAETKEEDKDDYPVTMRQLRSYITTRLQYMEKRIKNEMKDYIDQTYNSLQSFFLAAKGNNRFSIIHKPSQNVIVDNVVKEDAQNLLGKYLGMEEYWNGEGAPTKSWLTTVKEIYEEYKKAKPEEKPKLSIRRKGRKPAKTKLKIRRHGR